MATKTFKVPGLQAQTDADKVNQALHDVWGIQKVDVSLPQQEVTFMYDEKAAKPEDFVEAVLNSGYQVEGAE